MVVMLSEMKMTNQISNSHSKAVTTITTITTMRKDILDRYRLKQPFRVAVGKSTWQQYNTFDERYNLREILDDEIVIEFDCTDLEIVTRAISQTGINLRKAGYVFEYWDHKGKSPHLHIHDLPIAQLPADKRALFKKMFIRKYVPVEFLPYVDFSLTGIHLIAIEWAQHWKGCYDVKKLVHVFDEKEIYEEFKQVKIHNAPASQNPCVKCLENLGFIFISGEAYCKKCAYEVSR